MNKLIGIFLLLSIFGSNFTFARCIKDIIAIGLSSDSIAYSGELADSNSATLASDLAIGAKVSSIIFCPEIKYEFRPFLRLRNYSFSSSTNKSNWGNLPDSITLFSLGIEVRRPIDFLDHNIELPILFEVREEIGFGVDNSNSKVFKEDYINLLFMSGARYHIWKGNKRDITTVAKVGILAGLSESSSLGFIYGASAEYYQKIGKKMSLEVDMYFDNYNQGYGDISMNRIELGLRTNVIFRF